MDILDLLDADRVFFDMRPATKEELFRQIAQSLAEHGEIADASLAVRLLCERENLMTTGIGGGVSIPHAFVPGMADSLMAIAFAPEGVDFQALDKKPVHTVFLLLGSPKAQGRHLRVLARLSRMISSKPFMKALREAGRPESVIQLIREEEDRLQFDKPRTG